MYDGCFEYCFRFNDHIVNNKIFKKYTKHQRRNLVWTTVGFIVLCVCDIVKSNVCIVITHVRCFYFGVFFPVSSGAYDMWKYVSTRCLSVWGLGFWHWHWPHCSVQMAQGRQNTDKNSTVVLSKQQPIHRHLKHTLA